MNLIDNRILNIDTCVFLDLKEAFDLVDHHMLCQKLRYYADLKMFALLV